MKVWSKLGTVAALFLTAIVAPASVGCGSHFSRDEEPAQTGTLSTALQTVGTDGATYRFVPGSGLNVSSTSSTWQNSYPLDGTETTFTKKLGVGNYSLGISFGSWGTQPALVRTAGGVSTEIRVDWTDTHPIAFVINANATTSIVLHFSVPGLGNVTFSTGDLSITAQVGQSTSTQPKYVTEFSNLAVGNVTFNDPTASYASNLADADGNTRYMALGLQTTGPWALTGDQACIPVSVSSFGSSGVQPTFDRRLEQVLGGTGRACITNNGASDLVTITVSKDGPAPASQISFLPGTSYKALITMTLIIGDVFDGSTLQQTALAAGVTPVAGDMHHDLWDTSSGVVLLTELSASVITPPAQFKLEP